MSQKFYQAQKVAIAVATALTTNAAIAAEPEDVFGAYEIVNMDELFSVKGTLNNTQNGYGVALVNGTLVGISKGVNDGATFDDDTIVDDIIDAILPSEANSANSILRPFSGNDFLFEINAANPTPTYVPLLEDKPPVLNPSIDPFEEDEELKNSTPRTSANYYGAGGDAFSLRLGTTSALQKEVENPDYEEGNTNEPPNYYVRDFEVRGFIQNSDATEFSLVAPPYTVFEGHENFGSPLVDIGGYSVVSKISANGTYIAGYGSVDIYDGSEDDLNDCINDPGDGGERPLEACVQNLQNGTGIFYHNRALRWTIDPNDLTVLSVDQMQLGFVPKDDDDRIYSQQALAVNDNGFVVGRGYRSEKCLTCEPDLIDGDQWATFWTPSGDIAFVGPTVDDREEISESILEDVNSDDVAIGTIKQYIDGYERTKFGYVKLQDVEAGSELTFTQPNDFFDEQSNLGSRARDISDNNQVVGFIDIDSVSQTPRRVRGFVYDIETDTFEDINQLLTCRSRGLVEDSNGNYVEFEVTDTESFSEPVTYKTEITIVDANQIDEDGNISATALVKLPRLMTEEKEIFDEDGESQGDITVIVIGDNGKPVVERTANGAYATYEVPRAVLLRSTSEEICGEEIFDGINPEPNERKAAAVNWLWSLFLLPAVWLRRRK